MRFIMDGELFELTPELVLSRLADHHPFTVSRVEGLTGVDGTVLSLVDERTPGRIRTRINRATDLTAQCNGLHALGVGMIASTLATLWWSPSWTGWNGRRLMLGTFWT